MDTDPRTNPAAVAHAAEPTSWHDGDAGVRDRVEPMFVVSSWLLCLLATAVLFALGTAIVELASERAVLSETNTELGVLTIVAAMSTFIGFVLVMSLRLASVPHDRLFNSIAVAILHVAVAALVFLVEIAVRGITGGGVSEIFTGPWTDEAGNAFTVLERSAAASVLACLLAAGMVPARGDRPQGTQTAHTSQDRQL